MKPLIETTCFAPFVFDIVGYFTNRIIKQFNLNLASDHIKIVKFYAYFDINYCVVELCM